jgi:molybdate-binding protein/DNA-binding XRE family transcriptional regulator
MHTVALKRRVAGLTQAQLADLAGVSRSEISAIESGRLQPSVDVALRIAKVLGETVERLFEREAEAEQRKRALEDLGEQPAEGGRVWIARSSAYGGSRQGRIVPVESAATGVLPHDGILVRGRVVQRTKLEEAQRYPTLVLAGCDPAAGLLRSALAARGVRLLPLMRGSQRALDDLGAGRVDVAGIHLESDEQFEIGKAGDHLPQTVTKQRTASRRRLRVGKGTKASRKTNAEAVLSSLGNGYVLLRLGKWTEVLAGHPARWSGRAALTKGDLRRVRLVAREPGTGARECLQALLAEVGVEKSFSRFASDHRMAAALVRWGWGDATVCVELAAREEGLVFRRLRTEAYDLCFPQSSMDRYEIRQLVRTVKSKSFRQLLADLPGYDTAETGNLFYV